MVAVETKYAGEGQGSGKVPANSGRSTQPRELLLDSALSIFPRDRDRRFRLHGNVTFFKLPCVLSPLIHSSRSFEVHQAGGGLPVVQMNRYKKVGKIS